ncbi:recombinase family protein [Nocardia sp. NPDC049190]|uniref:recombinase family protein n=1 Tax=Nocardia sp. NPDC049190 TaxID=3155650 RepID=UPI0033C25DFC
MAGLRKRGIGFRSLHEALDTTTPGGRLVFHVFAALAEFIRELIVDGTNEGLAAARARGQRLGRPPAMTAEQIRQARAILTRPEETVSSVARLLGVSRGTPLRARPRAWQQEACGRRRLTTPSRTRPLLGGRKPGMTSAARPIDRPDAGSTSGSPPPNLLAGARAADLISTDAQNAPGRLVG